MAEAFGVALRAWRARRRMSQLALGLAADVSARHVSFLETGRARPSRAMVLRLCRELGVPLRERNHVLASAGFAPAHAERALSDEEMRPIRAAVDWTLERHVPFPAFALDRHWRLVALNAPAGRLFGPTGLAAGDGLAEALADNAALRGAIANLEEVLVHVVARLRTESARLGGDPVLAAAAARLDAGARHAPDPAGDVLPPVVPTRYRFGGAVLSLFSTVVQFGSAEDVALAELRLELLFPADEVTRKLLIDPGHGA
jgi:transcriptional regulator with XRE-family HTH domain